MSDPKIHEFDATEAVIDRERFKIEGDKQAAWAMRKLLALQEKATENEAIADAERTRIDLWLESVNGKFDSDIAYFTAILVEYGTTQRSNEDRKSIETPYGSVKSRIGQPKYVYEQSELIEWAIQSRPALVRVKQELDLAALKNMSVTPDGMVITEDGEIVPTVFVSPATVNYTVEVSK
jgi:hypothetical protein